MSHRHRAAIRQRNRFKHGPITIMCAGQPKSVQHYAKELQRMLNQPLTLKCIEKAVMDAHNRWIQYGDRQPLSGRSIDMMIMDEA